ncbi:MAG: hypothetical protein OEV64_10530 [Desulfobulbaceae bacterium]|nr:hypothetical protein [Desulfobulbaceae bacterium]
MCYNIMNNNRSGKKTIFLKTITVILLFLLLLASGCASSKIMVPAPSRLSIEPPNSVISFLKKGKKEPDSTLWEGEHFLGILNSETIIQRRLPTGSYFFTAITEGKCSFLRADIEADREYAVMILKVPDLGERFLPMAGKMTPKVEKWFSLYPIMVPLEQKRLAFEQRGIKQLRDCTQRSAKKFKGQMDTLSSDLYLVAHHNDMEQEKKALGNEELR